MSQLSSERNKNINGSFLTSNLAHVHKSSFASMDQSKLQPLGTKSWWRGEKIGQTCYCTFPWKWLLCLIFRRRCFDRRCRSVFLVLTNSSLRRLRFQFFVPKNFFLMDWCCCFRSNDVQVSKATFFQKWKFWRKTEEKTKRCWFFYCWIFWPGKSADKWIVSNLTLINPRVSEMTIKLFITNFFLFTKSFPLMII